MGNINDSMKLKNDKNRRNIENMWKEYKEEILKLSYKYNYSEEETKEILNRFDRLVEIKKRNCDDKRKKGVFDEEKAIKVMKINSRFSDDIVDYILGKKSFNSSLEKNKIMGEDDENEL